MSAEGLLSLLEDQESNSLVGGLLQQGGNVSLIETTDTLELHDLLDSLEEVLVLWVGGQLVVDQLGLQGLLRGDDKGRFSSSGAQTAEEVVKLRLLSEDVSLHV